VHKALQYFDDEHEQLFVQATATENQP